MSYTIDQVLSWCSELRHRNWTIGENNEIRDGEGFCPLCAILDERNTASDIRIPLSEEDKIDPYYLSQLLASTGLDPFLGCDWADLDRIIRAADNTCFANGETALRTQLKISLGVGAYSIPQPLDTNHPTT